MKTIQAALVLGMMAAPAFAETPKIYPFASKHNYCPQGLQPITINGVICCGSPNQSMSYQKVMAHSTPVKKHRHAKVCEEGVKGCS